MGLVAASRTVPAEVCRRGLEADSIADRAVECMQDLAEVCIAALEAGCTQDRAAASTQDRDPMTATRDLGGRALLGC